MGQDAPCRITGRCCEYRVGHTSGGRCTGHLQAHSARYLNFVEVNALAAVLRLMRLVWLDWLAEHCWDVLQE